MFRIYFIAAVVRRSYVVLAAAVMGTCCCQQSVCTVRVYCTVPVQYIVGFVFLCTAVLSGVHTAVRRTLYYEPLLGLLLCAVYGKGFYPDFRALLLSIPENTPLFEKKHPYVFKNIPFKDFYF